ncbi:chloroplastic,tRNA (mnm(5)s(2)U34)-methyltransferase [Trichinella pseudospiralis]
MNDEVKNKVTRALLVNDIFTMFRVVAEEAVESRKLLKTTLQLSLIAITASDITCLVNKAEERADLFHCVLATQRRISSENYNE